MGEKTACRRTVYASQGETKDIEVDHHVYVWSGKIPCTGYRRCIYCGEPEEERDDRIQLP